MKTERTEPDWEGCPQGAIRELLRERRRSRRAQRRTSTLIGSTAVAVVILVGILLLTNLTDDPGLTIAGITCREVRTVANDYVQNSLDDETASKVTGHIADCNRCRTVIERLKENVPPGTAARILSQPHRQLSLLDPPDHPQLSRR